MAGKDASLAENGVGLTDIGVRMSGERLPRAYRRRKERMEEVYRLHLEGRTIREISDIVNVSTRTVDRDLAEVRHGRRIALDRDPGVTRDLPRSVDEKMRLMNYMWKIVTRPVQVDCEGRIIDDTRHRIAAAAVVAKVSDSLDRLFGLDHVELRRVVDETRKLWESEKRNRVDSQRTS